MRDKTMRLWEKAYCSQHAQIFLKVSNSLWTFPETMATCSKRFCRISIIQTHSMECMLHETLCYLLDEPRFINYVWYFGATVGPFPTNRAPQGPGISC